MRSPRFALARRAALGLCLVLLHSASSPGADPARVPDAEAHRFIGKEATVCGRVSDATFMEGLRGSPTFLNMGGSYPNHTFTVVIWGDARAKFETAPHLRFADAEICVTGRVESFKGKPQIVVREPSQIVVTEAPAFPAQRYSYEERVVLKAILSGLGYATDPGSGEWDDAAKRAVEAFRQAEGVKGEEDLEAKTLRALAKSVEKLPEKEKTKILRLLLLNLAQREVS